MATQNDHIRAEELFSAYIDKHVTADEKSFVEQHVAVCADCRAKLQTTRAMVAALHSMPMMKAPRSFVLPKEMARQVRPRRSIFAWYPALRLATTLAAIAFVIVFAGDLLTQRGGLGGSVTMSASAPSAQAPAAELAQPNNAAPAAAPAPQPTLVAKAAPAQPGAATPEPPDQTMRTPAAETPGMGSGGTPDNSGAAVAAQSAVTGTTSQTLALAPAAPIEVTPAEPEPTQEAATGAATVEAPEIARSAAPAAAQAPAPSATQPASQPLDALRVATIALGVLVGVLGAATLIARRKSA
jgi:hypothetical protein